MYMTFIEQKYGRQRTRGTITELSNNNTNQKVGRKNRNTTQ